MAGIQVAESISSRKKAPKVLDHLRVSRALDGGHVVEHHYTSMEHVPRPYKFGPGEAEGRRAAAHIARHAGLPASGGVEEPDEAEEAGQE